MRALAALYLVMKGRWVRVSAMHTYKLDVCLSIDSQRDRGRDRDRDKHTHTHTHTHIPLLLADESGLAEAKLTENAVAAVVTHYFQKGFSIQ